MTTPNGLPSPSDIARKFLFLSRALDTGADELAAADEAAVRAKSRYLQAHTAATIRIADELRGSKALAAERDALVEKATHAEWLDMALADRKLRDLKERQSVLRDQVELTRSLNAGMRSEISLAGAA